MAIVRRTRTFSDLNFDFTTNPSTADVTKKFDEEAIKSSVKNLISTRPFERPFHPEIGSQVYALLFEPLTDTSVPVLVSTIRNTIEIFEPRVDLIDVDVRDNPDLNELTVTLKFKITNSSNPITLKTSISRVR